MYFILFLAYDAMVEICVISVGSKNYHDVYLYQSLDKLVQTYGMTNYGLYLVKFGYLQRIYSFESPCFMQMKNNDKLFCIEQRNLVDAEQLLKSITLTADETRFDEIFEALLPVLPVSTTLGQQQQQLSMEEEDDIVSPLQFDTVAAEKEEEEVRDLEWNQGKTYAVSITSSGIDMYDHTGEKVCSVEETKVISGCWYSTNELIYIYAIANTIKFLLPTGDHGVLREPFRLPLRKCLRAHDNLLYVKDFFGGFQIIHINVSNALKLIKVA